MADATDEKQKAESQEKANERAARRKRGRKNIAEGVVHIHSTFNNTIVTITDPETRRIVGYVRQPVSEMSRAVPPFGCTWVRP